MSPRARRWLRALAVLACVLLALKALLPWGISHVGTASMEPTIQGSRPGGERVLVVYGKPVPARFDVVVLLRRGEDTPLVKRVVGLPGERVQIVDGDLLVDGRPLPPEAPRPRPIPVFDERWQDPESGFPILEPQRAFWTRAQGEWVLLARSGAGARAASQLDFHGDVRDSFLDAQHARVEGELPVNDLVLECELQQDEPGTSASLLLSESGDRFELRLDLVPDGTLRASLLRRGEDPAQAPETLATRTLERGEPGWHGLRFSNIDNTLSFERDGVRLLQFSYAENRLARQEGRHLLPRASFGGADGSLRFRRLRIARDLFYTQRGSFGVEKALDLDPDGYFLLGDNSAFSRDGREWGQTRAEELIGRPLRIVWPPSDWRAIEGAVPPPALVR